MTRSARPSRGRDNRPRGFARPRRPDTAKHAADKPCSKVFPKSSPESWSGLTRRGALTEEDVNAALREVRRALLEADVALDVVRSFTDKARLRRRRRRGGEVGLPGQQVVKIVHDQLVEMLGADAETIDLNAASPVAILMVGLQGSGKTTTAAKIAKRLSDRERRRVLLASWIPGARPRYSSPSWAGRSESRPRRSSRANPPCRSPAAPWKPPASGLRRGDARHSLDE